MMRALRALVAFLGVGLAVYLYFALLHPLQAVQEHPFFEGTPTLAIAHQGGRGLWPENTLLAFERSLAMGVDVLEMDLRVTADGRMVVMHDSAVDRTTDGEGPLAAKTLEEVRKLDAGFRFPGENGDFPYRGKGLTVPSLEEVLARFPGARLNLEMKEFTPELAGELCDALREHGFARNVLVASFAHEPMATFRRSCPEVATSATMREGLLFHQLHRLALGSLFRSSAVAFQFPEYFGEIHVIQPRLLERARSFNVRVQVWTVNEEEDLRRMLALGVDGIVTDYPDRLLRLMNRAAEAGSRRSP